MGITGAGFVAALSIAALADGEPARVSVEFLADGRCVVAARGEGFRSDLTYLPQTALPAEPGFRCAVPPVPEGRAVELVVTLPPGREPSGRETPPLDWTRSADRWVGRASLAAAPSAVVIPGPASQSAADRWRWLIAAIGAVGAVLLGALVRGRRKRKR